MAQLLPERAGSLLVKDLLPEDRGGNRCLPQADFENVENDDGDRKDGPGESEGSGEGHGDSLRERPRNSHHPQDEILKADLGVRLCAAQAIVAAVAADPLLMLGEQSAIHPQVVLRHGHLAAGVVLDIVEFDVAEKIRLGFARVV